MVLISHCGKIVLIYVTINLAEVEIMLDIYVGVTALIVRDNKILLLKRAPSIHGGGMYCPPAGHVENNESMTQALVREMHEELSITIDPKDAECVHVLYTHGAERNYIHFYFVVNSWSGELHNNEPEKHTSMEWFDMNNVPENLLDHGVIKLWLSKKIIGFYSEK